MTDRPFIGLVLALLVEARHWLRFRWEFDDEACSRAWQFTPIAIALAQATGIDPRPLVVAVMIAASASFATPIGYQTNMLVMVEGKYEFGDYLRTGIPLVVLMVVSFSVILSWRYGL